MGKSIPKLNKLQKKASKNEGDLQEEKLVYELLKLSAKNGLYTCGVPTSLSSSIAEKLANAGYLYRDNVISFAPVSTEKSVVVECETICAEECAKSECSKSECSEKCCEGKCDPCKCGDACECAK